MRYRWLDTEKPVISVGRRSMVKGKVGCILALPIPGAIGNVLVDFGGTVAVVPAGTLRKKQRERGEATGAPHIPESLEDVLLENLNSCGGGYYVSGADAFVGTQAEYEGYVE